MGQTSVQREASQATRELLERIAAGPLAEQLLDLVLVVADRP